MRFGALTSWSALGRLLVGGLAFASLSSPAHAAKFYCWTFEFVPGEHRYVESQGNVQRGRYFYSQPFSAEGEADPMVLADAFKDEVRRTTNSLSSKSTYVSDCKWSRFDYEGFWRGEKPHDKWGRESDGRDQQQLPWTPSAALIEKAVEWRKSRKLFVQCLGARLKGDVGNGYSFVDDVIVSRTKAFETSREHYVRFEDPFRDDYRERQGDGARISAIQCNYAASAESLRDSEKDFLDHYKSAEVVDSDWKPDVSVKPVAASSAGGYKGPALTITAPKDVPKGWTAEQIARAREASADKAKALAASKRNDTEAQAKIQKFMQDMKKRGSAQ